MTTLEKSDVFAVTGLPQAVDLQRAINAGLLADKDIDFASSLIAGVKKYGSATPKQAHWIGVLYNRAVNPPKPVEAAQIGDMAPVYEMFARARKHLKFPAIVLASPNCSKALRLNVAGERSKEPGSINVCANEKLGYQDMGREWFGRISQDGKYTASRKIVGQFATDVTELLRRFAAEPAVVAKESAKLTGRCCFCNQALKDERSTSVGYGPICADHFGLPWGEKDASWKEVA